MRNENIKNVLLLLNSKSRSGAKAFNDLAHVLQENGKSVLNTVESLEVEDAFKMLIEKFHSLTDVLVVGGGDGTVNEVVELAIKHKLPICVLPLGTANNLARTLNIPTDPIEALQVLFEGQSRQIDIGKVNDQFFINVVGLGLSTEINRETPALLKKWLGPLAFVATAFSKAMKFVPFHAIIDCDGKRIRSRSWQITICNGRHYGNGLTIAEDASLLDQRLDCLSTEVKTLWEGFRVIPKFISGKYDGHRDLILVRGKTITIETRKRKSVDVDGDIKTKTPIKLSILPLALTVFVSNKQTGGDAKL